MNVIQDVECQPYRSRTSDIQPSERENKFRKQSKFKIIFLHMNLRLLERLRVHIATSSLISILYADNDSTEYVSYINRRDSTDDKVSLYSQHRHRSQIMIIFPLRIEQANEAWLQKSMNKLISQNVRCLDFFQFIDTYHRNTTTFFWND